ncbi:Protein PRY1 [Halotydeus destructor]|nr:Protein PRY1 [Halotydeus destructor]
MNPLACLSVFSLVAYSAALSATKDATTAKFQQQCLVAHNGYRKTHSSPALVVDSELVAFATKRAQTMAANSVMKHDAQGRGENLHMAWSSAGPSPVNCSAVVKAWYDEITLYDFKNVKASEANFGKVGHFTQVVWKGTTKVGCGQAMSQGGTFTCCNYMGPGNYLGQFEKNVLAKK